MTISQTYVQLKAIALAEFRDIHASEDNVGESHLSDDPEQALREFPFFVRTKLLII